MQVTLHDGTTVDCEDQPFSQGGEGELYFSRDGQHVIKRYLNQDPGRERTIQACLERYNILVKNPQYWGPRLGWPNAIVRHPWFGMRMYRVPGKMTELAWYLGVNSLKRLAMKSPEMLGNWLGRLQIVAEMSRTVWELHANGLCHADFSGKNFLANVSEGRIALIDCDGLVIPGELPPRVLGTPGYMAPEIYMDKAIPTIETDRHALAVLIYQTLLFRHPLAGPKVHSTNPEEDEKLSYGERALYIEHPRDKSNHHQGRIIPVSILGEEVQRLFEKVFVDHLHEPSKRPLPGSWSVALEHLLDRVVPCSNPRCVMGGAFPLLDGLPAKCPWCGTQQQAFSTVPQLQFYRQGAVGHFSPVPYHKVVGWKGRSLHVWHVDSTKQRGPLLTPDEEKPIAEFFPYQSDWHLINKGTAEISILDDAGFHAIAAQKGIILRSGMRVLFGSPGEGRVAVVQMRRLA